ncbi:hypothetical protein ACFLZB_03705 [Nanoarchaeota archaeon]
MKRRTFLQLAGAAFVSGCSGDVGSWFIKERDITMALNPAEPLVNTSSRFSGEHWDTAEVSLASVVQGIAYNGDFFYFNTAGRYVAVAHGVYGDNETGDDTKTSEIFARHTDKVAAIRTAVPAGTAIPDADWQTYLLPYLSPGTQQQISDFETNSALTLGTINSRLVNEQGLWYGITLTNPADLSDMGTGYAANVALTPFSLIEIVEQGHLPQTQQQSKNTVLQVQPASQMSDSPRPDDILPLPEGNIITHYVFDWLDGGLLKTMGVICGDLPRLEDQSVVDQYKTNTAASSAYRNPSLLLVPAGMKAWETRKAMDQEITNHNTN